MHYSHKMFMILCLTGSTLAFPVTVRADDVPPAIQALFDNIERQTAVAPTYDSLKNEGGNVTVTNLSLAKAASGDEPAMNFKVADAVFSSITEEGDGLYQIGSAKFSNMTADVAGKDFAMKLSAPDGMSEGWYVTEVADDATPEEMARAGMNVARKMQVGKMTVESQGQTFTVDSYQSSWDGDPETGAGTFDSKVANITIPEQAIALLDQGGVLKQLGYTSLSFDISGNGKTEIENGNMAIDFNGAISGRDMGAFKIGLAAADVPVAVFAELQKAQKEGKQPEFNTMMPQLQNASFSRLSIRFEDASLTGKLLPMIAAMQGVDQKTLIASASPMLQMGLMQLQNQAFAEQAAAAINAFLSNPKSLTIAAAPAAPLKVSEIMALNPAAPGEAITKLGISVKSND
jgi:hypothetical protein